MCCSFVSNTSRPIYVFNCCSRPFLDTLAFYQTPLVEQANVIARRPKFCPLLIWVPVVMHPECSPIHLSKCTPGVNVRKKSIIIWKSIHKLRQQDHTKLKPIKHNQGSKMPCFLHVDSSHFIRSWCMMTLDCGFSRIGIPPTARMNMAMRAYLPRVEFWDDPFPGQKQHHHPKLLMAPNIKINCYK